MGWLILAFVIFMAGVNGVIVFLTCQWSTFVMADVLILSGMGVAVLVAVCIFKSVEP